MAIGPDHTPGWVAPRTESLHSGMGFATAGNTVIFSGSMAISVEMQHTGDSALQAEGSSDHRTCACRSARGLAGFDCRIAGERPMGDEDSGPECLRAVLYARGCCWRASAGSHSSDFGKDAPENRHKPGVSARVPHLAPRSALQLFSSIGFAVRRCRPEQVAFCDGCADLPISVEFLHRRPKSVHARAVHLEQLRNPMQLSRVREDGTYFFIDTQNCGCRDNVTARGRLQTRHRHHAGQTRGYALVSSGLFQRRKECRELAERFLRIGGRREQK